MIKKIWTDPVCSFLRCRCSNCLLDNFLALPKDFQKGKSILHSKTGEVKDI
jgi:hypothetical protein